MANFVVQVVGPEKAWIGWDQNRNLPCFTFIQPPGVTKAEARGLMARASICCGGTLSIEGRD